MVFDRFARGRSAHARGESGGTGLGLSIVTEHLAAFGGGWRSSTGPAAADASGCTFPRSTRRRPHEICAPRTAIRVALLLTVLLLGGCGLPPDSSPRLLSRDDVPRGVNTTPSPASTGTARVLVYLIHDGVLVAVARAAPAPTPSDVLQALLGGPSRREQDAGLVTAVSTAAVDGARTSGRRHGGVPCARRQQQRAHDEVLAFGQIVLTLTSIRGVTAVRFTRDGRPLSVPRSDGSLNPAPLTRRDYSELL